jgi:hypothetical protein
MVGVHRLLGKQGLLSPIVHEVTGTEEGVSMHCPPKNRISKHLGSGFVSSPPHTPRLPQRTRHGRRTSTGRPARLIVSHSTWRRSPDTDAQTSTRLTCHAGHGGGAAPRAWVGTERIVTHCTWNCGKWVARCKGHGQAGKVLDSSVNEQGDEE